MFMVLCCRKGVGSVASVWGACVGVGESNPNNTSPKKETNPENTASLTKVS